MVLWWCNVQCHHINFTEQKLNIILLPKHESALSTKNTSEHCSITLCRGIWGKHWCAITSHSKCQQCTPAPRSFKVKLPPTLTTTIFSYVAKQHIQEMCANALFDQPLCLGQVDRSDPGSGFAFDIKSTHNKFISNMVCISPANQATHNELLNHLGSGGFGSVLEVLGSSLPNTLDSLTCY